MKLDVIKLSDSSVIRNIELNDDIFGILPRKDIISEVIRWQMAKAQAGTHAVKGRSDVTMTRKKLYKQKGTGNARHGAKTANIFRGGGVVFGPVVRSHCYKLNKKVRNLGLRSMLSQKAHEKNLFVCGDFSDVSVKTKEMRALLDRFGGKSALFVDFVCDKIVLNKAVSNLYRVDFLPVAGLNVLDGVRHEQLFVTEQAVNAITERLLGK